MKSSIKNIILSIIAIILLIIGINKIVNYEIEVAEVNETVAKAATARSGGPSEFDVSSLNSLKIPNNVPNIYCTQAGLVYYGNWQNPKVYYRDLERYIGRILAI